MQTFAKIESSKTYCRELLSSLNISHISPRFWKIKANSDYKTCKEIIDSINTDIVVKRDELCGGKGVTVQGVDFDNKYDIILDIVDSKNDILIEEKLVGEEFSLMTLCDSDNQLHFPPIRDYKRLNENDKGVNTGGGMCHRL